MKNIIHSFFAILMLAAVSFAQVNQQWVRSYNGPGNSNDAGYSIAVDASGNVYIAGSVYVTGQNNDYCVIKYSSGGVQQWVVTYNGPSSYDDAAISIGLDASSNIYVTGRSYSSASYDIYTMKISPAGGVFWGQTYNGPGNSEDMPVSMIVTPSGSVYIAGYSRGIGTLRDFTVIKYNTSGIIQWVQRYNGPANQEDVANALTLDPSGNLYAAGRSFVTGSYDDFCVVKYLPSGNVDWLQIYDSPYHSTDEAVGIVVDNGGNVYAGGKSIGTGTGYDYLLVKYNNSGNLQWAQRYNGTLSADDVLSGMVIDASNQIYLCGNGYGSGTGRDIVIVKYNPLGYVVGTQRYNGPGNNDDSPAVISIDGSQNIYVAGYSTGIGTGRDVLALKYDPSLVLQWAVRYNGFANLNDGANALALDASGNVYVTGTSMETSSNTDIATGKYSQVVGITPVNNQAPKEFALYQNYPNPFNPATKIKFDISPPLKGVRGMMVSLKVYDILGREIATLINQQLAAGSYEINFDAAKYPGGTYFYTVTAGDFSQTRRMVLVK